MADPKPESQAESQPGPEAALQAPSSETPSARPAPQRRDPGSASAAPLTPGLIKAEILCVLALSLGAAAVSAAISFLGAVTAPGGLAQQSASLVDPQAAAEWPWLDLSRQVYSLVFAFAPVALVLYLLRRSHQSARTIGFDLRRPGHDLLTGPGLAALIGCGGLAVYVVSWQLGMTVTVRPSTLEEHWWQLPVLILQAVKNGVLEEVIVVGYLMLRLDQLGWSPVRAAVASSVLRAFYHLYQGVGMFFGNLVMGLVFCWFYRRYGRVMPLVIAHSVIDIVAFAGAVYLIGEVSWLPGG
ncbi:membrane protease YdiL (CAAX protease family) [Spinactinospora alkalitolerans]|uniref:Membrane protease YdiL (CAAX protease family) n=1 Tax=Spinactinospora alkalitolerans TaxID=687207 RepID=A0A852U320_9ACTN|nr:type II CAAX endopeptidase family protein [Spinactinospora alkalitolerans]NYE48350.1 membrane protease YdiL (CAAX protease family) [Spinactinospora alkalitolerans]